MSDRTLYEVEVKAEGTLPTWYKLKRAVPCPHGNYAPHGFTPQQRLLDYKLTGVWRDECDGKPEADKFPSELDDWNSPEDAVWDGKPEGDKPMSPEDYYYKIDPPPESDRAVMDLRDAVADALEDWYIKMINRRAF